MKTQTATNNTLSTVQAIPQYRPNRIVTFLIALPISLIASCSGFTDIVQLDELEVSANPVTEAFQVQETQEKPKPGPILEQNPTLADNPEFGKPYRLDTFHVETRFPIIEIQKLQALQKNFWPVDTFVVFVELESLGKGDSFCFDDYQARNDGEIYETIRLSEWFRVIPPAKEGGMHIIRGFNRLGRCIYYREWVRSDAVPDPRLIGPSQAFTAKKRELPASIKIPKLRLPPTEE